MGQATCPDKIRVVISVVSTESTVPHAPNSVQLLL